MSIVIREPLAEDFEQWKVLFCNYQVFYRGHIPEDTMEYTWKRFFDPDESLGAFVAEMDGKLVGLIHYLYHDSTWNKDKSCYIEDLFVDKAARGSDVGRALLLKVAETATEEGAFRVYLHTQEYNGSGRSLYDSVLPLSSFIVYRKNLPL